MEAVTKKTDGNQAMAAEEKPQKPDSDRKIPPSYPKAKTSTPAPRPQAPVAPGQGFFSIYKKGQGQWTRMGTLGGVLLIGIVTGQFLFTEKTDFNWSDRTAYLIVAVFAAVYGSFAYFMMNRPTNVDFLIATDSEMKKVNWTSRKELVGSTKIVILFMFLIACVLFFYDLLFHTFFYYIHVLKTPPPFFPDKH